MTPVVRLFAIVVLTTASFTLACSLPTLESPECTEARDVVREFYSYHFDNNLGATDEDLVARQKYLTPAFFESLRNLPSDFRAGTDPFTWPVDRPKAFRIGECKVVQPGKETEFEVLLFWKDDNGSRQRSIKVGVENLDGKWLIKSVVRISSAIY